MVKRLPVVVMFAFLFTFSMPGIVASAHTVNVKQPLTFNCTEEQCDGFYPTSYQCPAGDVLVADVKVYDSHSVYIGDLKDFYNSTVNNPCFAWWITYLPRYNSNSDVYTITSSERTTNEATNNWPTYYQDLTAGHYFDAQMEGYDSYSSSDNSLTECFIGGLDFLDVYGVQKHFNVPTACLSGGV